MIKTLLTPEIVQLLDTDPIQALNIYGAIENSPQAEIYVDSLETPRGVLVRVDYFNYIFTKSEAFLQDLIDHYYVKDDFYGFSGCSNFVASWLKPHFTKQWESPCHLYYLPPGALKSDLKTRPTTSIPYDQAELVDRYYTYRDTNTLAMIQNNIKTLPSSAYFVDGEMVCWCLVHDDNSLGIMYTLEDHRGKGYAVDVTVDLCEKEIARGKQPYLQIHAGNQMSPGLALKTGFEKYGDRNAIWFGGFKGVPQAYYEVDKALKMNSDSLLSIFDVDLDDLFKNFAAFKVSVVQKGKSTLPTPTELEGSHNEEIHYDFIGPCHIDTNDKAMARGPLLARATLLVHDHYWSFLSDFQFEPSNQEGLAQDALEIACLYALLKDLQGLEINCLLYKSQLVYAAHSIMSCKVLSLRR